MKLWKQKLGAIMVLLLFMLSVVPAALGESGSGSSNQTETDNEGDTSGSEEADDNNEDTSDDESEVEIEEETEIETEDGQIKIVRKIKRSEKADLKMENAKIRLEKARENFERAKENYREALARFQENKDKLVRIKDKIKVCPEGSDCAELKTELKKGVRQHLLKTSDLIDRSLSKLLSKVEDSPVLSDEEKAEALASIKELETELAAKRTAVEALAEESVTNEELKAAIKDLKATWIKVRKEQRAILAGLMNSRQEDMAKEKLPEINTALLERISQMRDSGADVAGLEALQVQFEAKMSEVQQNQAQAQEKWLQFKSGEAEIETWKEAQGQVRESLREAKAILREFMQEYKELKKGLKESNRSGEDAEESEGAETATA